MGTLRRTERRKRKMATRAAVRRRSEDGADERKMATRAAVKAALGGRS